MLDLKLGTNGIGTYLASKQTLATWFSLHPCLYQLQGLPGWHTHPLPQISPAWDWATLPYIIQQFCYVGPFLFLLIYPLPSWPLGLDHPSPSPLPVSSHGPVKSGCIYSGLAQMVLPLTALFLVSKVDVSPTIPRSSHALPFALFIQTANL